MTSQQDLQVAISLRKFNLEDIANHFTNNVMISIDYVLLSLGFIHRLYQFNTYKVAI